MLECSIQPGQFSPLDGVRFLMATGVNCLKTGVLSFLLVGLIKGCTDLVAPCSAIMPMGAIRIICLVLWPMQLVYTGVTVHDIGICMFVIRGQGEILGWSRMACGGVAKSTVEAMREGPAVELWVGRWWRWD